MTRRRVLLVIGFFIVGVVLVWLPYRIHIANYATDLRFVVLSILTPLCLFTAAVFIALGAPERVRATEG
jgi:K+-transporting ATPase A subunit